MDKLNRNIVIAISLLLLLMIGIIIAFALFDDDTEKNAVVKDIRTQNADSKIELPNYVDVQLIDIDGHARRGVKLDGKVKDIVIHYVANPMSTAQNNRDYFNNPETTVSSHFVIGLEGEVIMCVPLDEKSSASNHRNADTISIEVCHEDETGKFNDATYNSLVKLTAWLCKYFDLGKDNIIRHYDVTGKACPVYYVEHQDKWEEFKNDVMAYLPTV